jgi:hypothetical protein
MSAGSFILNSATRGVLNSNTLYGQAVTITATASAPLGRLASSVQTAASVIASASASLGGLTSASTSQVIHNSSLSASLGSLDSTATSITQILPVLNADLGSLSGVVTATVTHIATAQAVLDGLLATANTTPTIKPVFMGSLGTLEATATATVIQPTPPEPEFKGYGSNRPYAQQPRIKPKPEPVAELPVVVITETLPARPVRMPATIVVSAQVNTTQFLTIVNAQVEWSILEDEAELLLML